MNFYFLLTFFLATAKVDYDLMEDNLLYMVSHPTTPTQVSSYLLNMLDNYPEEEEDIQVWCVLVNDYLLSEGLPPLEYRYRLSEQSWKHPTSFLRPEEEEERRRIVMELHKVHKGESELGAVLEAKGRMLSDRDEWEEFLKDYSIAIKREFPADPHVVEELEKSRKVLYNRPHFVA